MASRKKASRPESPAADPAASIQNDAGAESASTTVAPDAAERERQIRDAAYAAYERRSGDEGNEIDDWLHAEGEWERNRKG